MVGILSEPTWCGVLPALRKKESQRNSSGEYEPDSDLLFLNLVIWSVIFHSWYRSSYSMYALL